MTRSGVRSLAFTISLFMYVILDTLVTASFIRNHIPSTHPELATTILIAARSLQLATILLVVEQIAVRLWARRILGLWAYRSDSGNFGVARIGLIHGELHYRVELYRKPEDVVGALKKRAVVQPFAHVNSHICRYADSNFETDYHIDYTASGYPPRRGLLVLIHTLDKHVMTGHWYSTGGVSGTEIRTGRLDFRRRSEFLRNPKIFDNPEPIEMPPALPPGQK